MSKRRQAGTSREGSAMAKPKTMNLVMAKPRPTKFGVAQSVECEEKFSAKCERFQ